MTMSPPITARARGSSAPDPTPMPTAVGIMARIVPIAVMRIGRRRVEPASTTAR